MTRLCTCDPDDRPPVCQMRYAASECQAAYRSWREPRLPRTKSDWSIVLNAIDWIQHFWPELQKADCDVREYGVGYVRITPAGIQHVPLERIGVMPPKQPSCDTKAR